MATTLNCLGWMQNQRDQTPCVTAQDVGQLCNAEYSVSTTNFQESNYVPNATTTNGCTCSWSVYNLLSACSYCVEDYQYTSWDTWVVDCESFVSNTSYLPSGLHISQGIPYWAATNPSTWDNAVFNVAQAADIAAAGSYFQFSANSTDHVFALLLQAHPDVTGGPLPTSTSTATPSSASNVSVGSIIGGVIGTIAIITGGLIICWVVRRRRQRTHANAADASFNATGPVIDVPVPSTRHQTHVQPSQYGYTYGPVSPRLTSPVRSMTSLAATSLFTSPASSGFSSHRHSMSLPLTDAADVITPFLTMSPTRPTNRSTASLPTGKATEALYERTTAPSGQRARLNPPPYSALVAPESPGATTTTTGARRMSTKKQKKQNGGGSGATTYPGHPRTSTGQGATTVHADLRTEQSRSRVTAPGERTVVSVGREDGSGRMEATHIGECPSAV